MARRNAIEPHEESMFTEQTLKAFARDLKSGRLPLERSTISDDRVLGLRAMVTKDGRISFHVTYSLGDSGRRPFMFIGTFEDAKSNENLTIDEARKIAEIVKHLGKEHGTDIEAEGRRALIKGLLRDGIKWRAGK